MSAGTGHCLHEFDRGAEKIMQLSGGFLNAQALALFFFLCRDAGRAIVGVAHSGCNTADGLHGTIGKCNAISPQGHGFYEIYRHTQSTCNDQRDTATGPVRLLTLFLIFRAQANQFSIFFIRQ